jgi:hypothetical protein
MAQHTESLYAHSIQRACMLIAYREPVSLLPAHAYCLLGLCMPYREPVHLCYLKKCQRGCMLCHTEAWQVTESSLLPAHASLLPAIEPVCYGIQRPGMHGQVTERLYAMAYRGLACISVTCSCIAYRLSVTCACVSLTCPCIFESR